jgi:hypothetical protein
MQILWMIHVVQTKCWVWSHLRSDVVQADVVVFVGEIVDVIEEQSMHTAAVRD